jgi:hypothetical protein
MSIRGAANALRRKPAPKPKRRGRKLMLAAALGIGAALLAGKRARAKARTIAPDRSGQPGPQQTTEAEPAAMALRGVR